MSNDLKEISSPFSTGGGGIIFETRIQASFAVLMLANGYSPCLPPLPIQKIQLQGRYKNYRTDDFIVYVEDKNTQQEAKLLVQVKHDIDLTEGSRVFEEVIAAIWADFNNAKLFTKGKDVIALITGLLKGTDLEVKTLLEWARSADDSSDFINKVEMTNFSSDVKRSKLKALKKHLKTANKNNDISNDELWQFLKSFHLLVCDLDIEKGINLALLVSGINYRGSIIF